MLKVEAIAELEIRKLATDDAGKRRSDVTVTNREFGHTACVVMTKFKSNFN